MSIFRGFWNWLGWSGCGDTFDSGLETIANAHDSYCHDVNPATSLPMGSCGLDVAGNPYGVNLNQHDHWPSCHAGTSVDTYSSTPFSAWDD